MIQKLEYLFVSQNDVMDITHNVVHLRVRDSLHVDQVIQPVTDKLFSSTVHRLHLLPNIVKIPPIPRRRRPSSDLVISFGIDTGITNLHVPQRAVARLVGTKMSPR
jgi:hypothetical protein